MCLAQFTFGYLIEIDENNNVFQGNTDGNELHHDTTGQDVYTFTSAVQHLEDFITLNPIQMS